MASLIEQGPGTSTTTAKKFISKAQSVDDGAAGIRGQRKVSGIYTKHASASGLQNGTSRVPKLQRQFSTTSFTLPSGPNTRRTSIVIDPEKFEAAKKRRQDSILKKDNDKSAKTLQTLPSNKKSWKSRLKLCTTIVLSVLLILSCSSLLFICLLIVDPIIVGLRADFKTEAGICRTVWIDERKGPLNCSVPTCREGCTSDIFFCTFIQLLDSEIENFIIEVGTDLQLSPMDNGSLSNSAEEPTRFYNGTLMINPNGCGYSPSVNCTEFEEKYSEVGKTFPCFYSSSLFVNEDAKGVAIPFYDRNEEMTLLGFYLGIPLGLVGTFLVFLLIIVYYGRNSSSSDDKLNLIVEEEAESDNSIFSKSNKHLELSQQLTGSSLESNGNGAGAGGHNFFLKKINGHTSRDNT